MYRNALLSRLADATPEFKYFLLVCLRFEVSVIDSWLGVEPLAGRLGMGVRTITNALKFFAKHNLFTVEQVLIKGRMRARYWLRSDIAFERDMEIPEPLMVYQALVDYILFAPYMGKKTDLRASDRLLLAILVGYADESGVVRCLGGLEISILTGIGRSAIPGRMERLRDKGYIRTSVPGINGSYIFQKAKSIHFLDLAHPCYGEAAPSYNFIFRDVDFGLSDLAKKLMQGARYISGLNSVEDKKKEELVFASLSKLGLVLYRTVLTEFSEYFIGHPDGGMERYLAAKLDDFAALILAKGLAGGTDMNALPRDRLHAKVLYGLGFRGDASDRAKEGVTNIILDLALLIARHIHSLMEKHKEVYENRKIVVAILPGARVYQRSVVVGYQAQNEVGSV